jgi:hypothetical protein
MASTAFAPTADTSSHEMTRRRASIGIDGFVHDLEQFATTICRRDDRGQYRYPLVHALDGQLLVMLRARTAVP